MAVDDAGGFIVVGSWPGADWLNGSVRAAGALLFAQNRSCDPLVEDFEEESVEIGTRQSPPVRSFEENNN